jgi:hypothetical protein
MILILAANTGYQDFPRLSSFLAHDGFLPRWMQNRGDRLVFSSGILILAAISSLLVIVFQANEIAMLPLYALGVMLSFTLSQAGMVRLMGKISRVPPGRQVQTGATTIHYEPGWWWKRAVNSLGAVTTGIVLVVLIATKFVEGAWLIVVAVPAIVWLLRAVHNHYTRIAEALRTHTMSPRDLETVADVVIIPIADVHRGTLRAIKYAKRLAADVRAVSIITSPAQRERIHRRWERFPDLTAGVRLVLIDYDFRDILHPLVEYIHRVSYVEFPNQLITVVIPEFVPDSLTGQLLHNQTANFLRFRLRGEEDIVVIDVPYLIKRGASHAEQAAPLTEAASVSTAPSGYP